MSTFSCPYGRTDRNGLPLLETLTKNGNTYQFDYDHTGTPVALRVQSGNRNFFVLDGHGSVVNLVKDDGTVSGTYTYDPYGDPLTATGTGEAAGINVHRYALGLADTDTGWTKHGIRWNDTTTGTWTTQDPLTFLLDPNNGNRYNYAAANPINYLDPTGRAWCGGNPRERCLWVLLVGDGRWCGRGGRDDGQRLRRSSCRLQRSHRRGPDCAGHPPR